MRISKEMKWQESGSSVYEVAKDGRGLTDPIANCNNEANAQLIAEAGTVTHETGFTPRQFADQNKKLREALQNIRSYLFAGVPIELNLNEMDAYFKKLISIADEALKTPKQ